MNGQSHLGTTLLGGCGTSDEVEWTGELWNVSQGKGTMDGFLGQYGHHGPAEGELSSHSWREDPAPLYALMDRYAVATDPRLLERRQRKDREEAERRALSGCPFRRRLQLRIALRTARRLVPLRGIPKSAYIQAFDVARAAARNIGDELVSLGVLDAPGDVFFLDFQELRELGNPGAPLGRTSTKAEVERRRQARESYSARELLLTWKGNPVADELDAHGISIEAGMGDRSPALLRGTGVSAGTYTGRVRVVTDLAAEAFEPDEVLVCHTTDPSWASLFVIAGAIVIDIGGFLSHGAIIARELGRPCVLDTRVATRILLTGDIVKVDGDRGTVEVLKSTDQIQEGTHGD
jgi:pyruvate,water dikinase